MPRVVTRRQTSATTTRQGAPPFRPVQYMPQRGAPSMAAKRHVESGAGSVQPARDDPWADAPIHLQELLTLASDLARDAGQVHAEGMRSALRIETKSSPTDLVSQVDRESERMIVGPQLAQ